MPSTSYSKTFRFTSLSVRQQKLLTLKDPFIITILFKSFFYWAIKVPNQIILVIFCPIHIK